MGYDCKGSKQGFDPWSHRSNRCVPAIFPFPPILKGRWFHPLARMESGSMRGIGPAQNASCDPLGHETKSVKEPTRYGNRDWHSGCHGYLDHYGSGLPRRRLGQSINGRSRMGGSGPLIFRAHGAIGRHAFLRRKTLQIRLLLRPPFCGCDVIASHDGFRSRCRKA